MTDRDTSRPDGAGPARPSDTDPAMRSGPPRPALLGIGVVAAVVLVLLAIFLLRPDGEAVSEASPSPATSAAANEGTPNLSPSQSASSPSVRPSPSPTEAAAAGWQQISFKGGTDLEQRAGFTLNDLTYDAILRRWFTAEGYRDWTGTLDPLPVFSSTDGANWSQTGTVSLPADFTPNGTIAESVQVGRILRLGDTLYLSGGHSRGVDFARSLAWTSVDGNEWTATPTDLPPEATVEASSGDSLVANTSLITSDGTRLWRSSDGSSWTEAALPTSEPVTLHVYGDDAGFIALGATMARQAEDRTPVVWRSADGMTWEPMALPSDLRFIGEVVRFPDGRYLIWGSVTPLSDDERTVQMWVSDDGVSWTPTERFGRAGTASAVGAASSGAIYLGVHDGFLRAWASPDGRSWREVPAAQPVPEVIRTGHVTDVVYVQSLVVTEDRWVGMGQGSEDYVSDLWIGLDNP